MGYKICGINRNIVECKCVKLILMRCAGYNVLIETLWNVNFFVDLWGETEGGKY